MCIRDRLWEDKPDTASLHSHLRNLIFDLSHALEDAGAVSYTHLDVYKRQSLCCRVSNTFQPFAVSAARVSPST